MFKMILESSSQQWASSRFW